MSVAYLDTSVLVAIAFGEPGSRATSQSLEGFSRLISSNLLESELRAAFAREGVELEDRFLSAVDWVLPDRPLSAEYGTVLKAGHLRGAALWHLATALYICSDPSQIWFITLDNAQQAVASKLGFRSPTLSRQRLFEGGRVGVWEFRAGRERRTRWGVDHVTAPVPYWKGRNTSRLVPTSSGPRGSLLGNREVIFFFGHGLPIRDRPAASERLAVAAGVGPQAGRIGPVFAR